MCYLVTYMNSAVRNAINNAHEGLPEPYDRLETAMRRAETLSTLSGTTNVKVWKLYGEPVFKPQYDWKLADPVSGFADGGSDSDEARPYTSDTAPPAQ